MKRIISMTLCVLLVLVALVACSTPQDKNDSVTTADAPGSGEIETTPGESGEPDLEPLPDLNFNNSDVKILYWSDVNNQEFVVDGITGSLIDDAIYNRNIAVETRLGVHLVWNGQPGSKKNLASFQKYVQNNNMAGDKDIEIIAVHSMVMGALASEGLLNDLLETEYIDFNQPWWPEDLIENSTIHGKLYFASGDISLNTLLGMEGMFFNKSMATNNLYEYVDNGTWTLERMMAESANVYSDVNGNSKDDDDDIYGYVTYSGMINPLFVGCGIRFVDKNENGDIIISDTYGSEKTHGLLTRVENQLFNSKDWLYCPKIDNSTAIFKDGRSLFYMASVRLTVNNLADAEKLQYGIIPNPKYDEAQENYHTLMANTYTMYGINNIVTDTDITSAVIEVMGYEGYKSVTPAVFEVALKTRYSNTGDDARMFDILRDTTVMEIGLIFSDQLGGVPSKGLFSRVDAQNTDWMSYINSQKKTLNNYLTILNAAFTK